MHEAQGLVLGYLVNSAWQTPLFFLAAWMASRIFRSLGCEAQHRVWVAGLVLAALAPLGALKQSEVRVHLLLVNPPFHILMGPQTPSGERTSGVGAVHLASTLSFLLLFGYLAFLTYSCLRLAWAFYKTRTLARNSTGIALPPEAADVWARCKSAFAIGSATLAASQEVNGPVTIGTFKAVLLLPSGFLTESTRDDLVAALGHECAHLERRDFPLNLLYELIVLPIAYHPATWVLRSRMAETRELVCDRMAAERLAGSHAYAQSLLRLAGAMIARPKIAPHYAIGMFDADATMEKRIMSLMETQLPISGKRKITLLAPGILLFSLSCIAAVALTVNVEQTNGGGPPQAAASPATDHNQVYKVGDGVSAPKLVYAPDPDYPAGERKKGKFSGVCVLGLVVDALGKPQRIHVVRPLGPDYDENAILAVREYRFKPAMLKGKPVAVKVNIEVNFRFW